MWQFFLPLYHYLTNSHNCAIIQPTILIAEINMSDLITIAVPKGRLLYKIADFLAERGITLKEESRKLDYIDEAAGIRFLFVKNADVPVYVNYGVADLGICGSDIIYESDFDFLKLHTFPFGTTRICLAGYADKSHLYYQNADSKNFVEEIRIATKFVKFTKNCFLQKNIPIEIIKLTGSIELAPILGLSDFIVDLVETGTTLAENNLSVIEELGRTEVRLIANPALYKLNYKKMDELLERIKK